MNKKVWELFTREILEKAISRWGGNSAALKLVGYFENFVFEFNEVHKNFILRITHSSHRNKELIEAELDWLNFLASNDFNICKPILSVNNFAVETIPNENTNFYVCAFEKARGQNFAYVNPKDYKKISINLGKLVGKLHSTAKKYPANRSFKRKDWYEDDNIINARMYLPADKISLIEELNELTKFFRSFTQNIEDYGLIHADIHGGNMFVDGDDLILFDFDDCCYHWYIYDIVSLIHTSVVLVNDPEERKVIYREFTNYLFEGYFLENRLDEKWFKLLPELFRLRELVGYVKFFKSRASE